MTTPHEGAEVPQSPAESSDVPHGLSPSPGIAPPPDIQPPPSFQQAPVYAPPMYQAPPAQQPPAQQPSGQQPAQGLHDSAEQRGAIPSPGHPSQFPLNGVAPQKHLSTGAIVGIVAGGIVLLFLIVGGFAFLGIDSLLTGSDTDKQSAIAAPADPTRDPAPEGATLAVEQYLEALAAGDAATARALTGAAPSETFLTDEVLQASTQLAPITNINVDTKNSHAVDEHQANVSASFDIGDDTFTRDFTTQNDSGSDDGWEVDGLIRVPLNNFDGLGLKVNGVQPGEDFALVFVGAYRLTLDAEDFTIDGDDTIVLTSFADATPVAILEPTLTEEATKTFRDLVRGSLKACLVSTALATPCGMDATENNTSGATPVEGTIQRTLTSRGETTLKALKPYVSDTESRIVSSKDVISAQLAITPGADGTRGSDSKSFEASTLRPYVDFSKQVLRVTWE